LKLIYFKKNKNKRKEKRREGLQRNTKLRTKKKEKVNHWNPYEWIVTASFFDLIQVTYVYDSGVGGHKSMTRQLTLNVMIWSK
jgi:hypothetical protein